MSTVNSVIPRLAVTIGDPTGIGPEVVLKALANPDVTQNCQVTVIGSRAVLTEIHQMLKSCAPSHSLIAPEQLAILETPLAATTESFVPGQATAASGAASFQYLETAISHALAGKFDGIVTAPIAKSAWKAAGHLYPGQTELLAERSGVSRFGMLFVARSPHTGWTLRTLLATTHIPLQQVPTALTPELLTHKLDLLIECLQQEFGLQHPRIAIAGLNPHSGEQGQLGREEQDWMIPWLEQSRERLPLVQLDGPIPPDTLWVKPGQAWYGSKQPVDAYDAYLALYHDQGLIPVKLMAFDRAVNTSIGLPFVRTSPDHGTAFNIAGRGIADASSMEVAIQLATELCQNRQAIMSKGSGTTEISQLQHMQN